MSSFRNEWINGNNLFGYFVYLVIALPLYFVDTVTKIIIVYTCIYNNC